MSFGIGCYKIPVEDAKNLGLGIYNYDNVRGYLFTGRVSSVEGSDGLLEFIVSKGETFEKRLEVSNSDVGNDEMFEVYFINVGGVAYPLPPLESFDKVYYRQGNKQNLIALVDLAYGMWKGKVRD